MDKKIEMNVDKVKTHFKEHWKDYCLSIGAIVIVGMGVYIYVKDEVSDIHDIKADGNNSPINILTGDHSTITNVAFAGRQRKIIQCVETGEVWASIKDAARDLGISRTNISKTVNGHMENAEGLHFRIIGLGTK